MDIEPYIEKMRLNATAVLERDDVYLDESTGLLHCVQCGEPRQKVVCAFGKNYLMPVLCTCKGEALECEKAEIAVQEQQKRVERLRKAGITDRNYLVATFEADKMPESKTGQTARKYCANWQVMQENNQGLLLWGNPGTGKSFYAACIANALINVGVSVLMTSLPKLIDAIGANYGEDKARIMQQITDNSLLIIDDLGVERNTPTAYERVFETIDARYRTKKPLIVTTNLSLQQIAHPEDKRYARIYDRIMEICLPIKLDGESKRLMVAMEKAQEMKNILGL